MLKVEKLPKIEAFAAPRSRYRDFDVTQVLGVCEEVQPTADGVGWGWIHGQKRGPLLGLRDGPLSRYLYYCSLYCVYVYVDFSFTYLGDFSLFLYWGFGRPLGAWFASVGTLLLTIQFLPLFLGENK